MNKLFILLVGLVIIFTACQKDVLITDNNSQGSDLINMKSIKCESGVLIFEDQASLIDFEIKANKLGMFELAKWEKSRGFESQKSIFENIALKEYKLQIKPYEGKTDEEMRNIPFPGHCPEYAESLKNGLIKEINEPEGSYIDYNLYDRSKAIYLNREGLVMVGNELYFVKENITKSIKNATLANSNELLKSGSSNLNSNIKSVLSGSYAAYKTSYWVNSDSKNRANLDVTLTIQTFGANSGTDWSQAIQGYPLTLHTNAQHKNFWGSWNQAWGEEYIGGTASLHLDWSQDWYNSGNSINGLYNDFTTNVYLPSASNATLQWNPFTGERTSNLEYAIATAPYNGYYHWGIKPITFVITAALPGGCCGINCSVEW